MNYKSNWKFLKWNNNILSSIKKAERLKTLYENKGYTLMHTHINTITGECEFIYKIKDN